MGQLGEYREGGTECTGTGPWRVHPEQPEKLQPRLVFPVRQKSFIRHPASTHTEPLND